MIHINGAQGEGGGQILRSALTLAMCLKKSITLSNIRQGRKKPGLMRQHLACVKAAAEICQAKVSGASLGSQSLTFEPGEIQAGTYRFAIGSAGSTCLLFQTVLPALARANGLSEVILEGGTHSHFSPSFDFIRHTYLPQMQKLGYRVEVDIERYGFYPVGGGRWKALVYPLDKQAPALDLTDLGELISHEGVVSYARLARHISEREVMHVHKRAKWKYERLDALEVESLGAGNVVSLRANFQHHTTVCDAIGEVGVSAERVAGRAVQSMAAYIKSNTAVCEYLADQLLLPMALGQGGRFTSVKPSLHTTTHCDVIAQLTHQRVQMQQLSKQVWLLSLDKERACNKS